MSLRLLVLFIVLFLAACGGDDEESAPTSEAAASSCEAATTDLMTPLGNGMKDDQVRVKNGRAVKSDDHAEIFFVSAEVYGSGVSEGTIGTWATTSLGGAEAVWTVDDVSKQYSDLRDGTAVADLSNDDHGVAESRACVAAA
jgi:hypothetical protein